MKKNAAVAVLIAVLGLGVAGGAVYYAVLKTQSTPQLFNPEKEAAAEKLYAKVQAYDLRAHYPPTPEDVMEAYNDMFLLLYGDMVVAEDTLREVFDLQRRLCSPELLDGVGVEDQFARFKENLEKLAADKVYCARVETKATLYDSRDINRCTIRAILYFNGAQAMHRNYYFTFNTTENRWQVSNWAVTDENFEPLGA
jgi:hypothetical protein